MKHADATNVDSTVPEAEQIGRILAEHASQMRTAPSRGKRRIDGIEFRFFRADRNVIYRITGRHRWYLKLPTRKIANIVRREQSGAAGAAEALADDPCYRDCGSARFSVDDGYILYPQLPGITSNRLLYRACYSLRRSSATTANELFAAIGRALARLHSYQPDTGLPPANRSAKAAMAHTLERVSQQNGIAASIGRWFQEASVDPVGQVPLVHANFTLENVLTAGGKFTFIDFENCGAGVVYDDLSLAGSRLLLTEAIRWFPHKRARAALSAFLAGYREIGHLDGDEFQRYVALRVARFYLENYARGKKVARVGGIPLSRSRIERILWALQKGELASVAPGVLP